MASGSGGEGGGIKGKTDSREANGKRDGRLVADSGLYGGAGAESAFLGFEDAVGGVGGAVSLLPPDNEYGDEAVGNGGTESNVEGRGSAARDPPKLTARVCCTSPSFALGGYA